MTSHHFTTDVNLKTKDKQYKCKVCFQWFLTLGELDFHKLTHNPSPPPTCYMCVQRKFSSREQLRDHLKEKHAKNKAGLWACGMCLKEISDVWMYNEHLREHATQFARKGQAQKSVMGLPACFGEDNVMHVIKKSFICSMCNYTFSKKEQYDRHMEKHLAGSNKTFKFRGVMRPGIASREGREKVKDEGSLQEGMPPNKKRKVVHRGSSLPHSSPVRLDHTSDLQLIEVATPSPQAPSESYSPIAASEPGAPPPQSSVKTEDLVGDFSDLLAEMEKSQFDALPPPPCLSPSLPPAALCTPPGSGSGVQPQRSGASGALRGLGTMAD
uniref:C2H2-type domain-containing protein n=1 Tax=Dromaius novaehollandiae TaxID=8790 RepID=A0A8C4JH02_DRONO